MSDEDWRGRLRPHPGVRAGRRGLIPNLETKRASRSSARACYAPAQRAHEPIPFTLPKVDDGRAWQFELDTGEEKRPPDGPQDKHKLLGRALAVFRLPKKSQA